MSKFKTSYNRFKHTWSIGLACRALLYVCSAFVLITLLIGVADFLFAFGQKTRTIVYYTLLVSTLVGLLVTLVRSILSCTWQLYCARKKNKFLLVCRLFVELSMKESINQRSRALALWVGAYRFF